MTTPATNAPAEEFPAANVKPEGVIVSGRILESKLWWITLLCLVIAGSLAWHSHRPTGTEITISFPEGHGLKAGDALRHRGIDIGIVTVVELAADLHGVQTTVAVDESAEGIANEASRFWIVRPQLSLTSISGLETAVGAKYIAVDPGPADSPSKRDFDGLETPPAIEINNGGMEFRLRADESFGINPSSPIAYRGIRVGQVISVELANDAMHVDIVANIESRYQPLLRRGSKFWKTSGVDVDFGLKGFHLSTESLAAVAMGGVSFVTPQQRDPTAMEPVEAGHAYELHPKLDKDWLDDAVAIDLSPAADD